MLRAVICACLAALSLAACSSAPLRRDVIAQARPDGEIAFDVVKVDDSVIATLQAQQPPGFAGRFKDYTPPPALKIGVGDVVSVVVFEATGNGLFGESLTEVSLPPGAVIRRLLSPTTPPLGSAAASLLQLGPALELSARLGGDAGTRRLAESVADPDAVSAGPRDRALAEGAAQRLFGTGGAAPLENKQGPQTLGGNLRAGDTLSTNAGFGAAQARRSTAENADNQNLQTLLEAAVQSGRPGTRIPDQQVGSDGGISIPYAGRIIATGHTPEEVARTVEQRLAGKAIEPQALVVIRRNLANTVAVAGEVVGGARVALSPGGDRLLQVIAAAGGALAPAHETFVRLSRGDATATVPLATLVAHPDENIFAEPGDVLTLVRRPQSFSVFGAAGKNTAISFDSATLSLGEALAKAGGLLDERADASAVFLFRYEPVSLVQALGQPVATDAPPGVSPIVYRLDLREAKSYLLARQFRVRDKDIIFVADAESRPVYKFFETMSKVVGPIETGIVACINTKC